MDITAIAGSLLGVRSKETVVPMHTGHDDDYSMYTDYIRTRRIGGAK
jgi:hypothetical protein